MVADEAGRGDDTRRYGDIVESAPTNWGRWGSDDEVGAINVLDSDAVLRGIGAVKAGDVIPLGMPIAHPDGDPVWPTRTPTDHHMTVDRGDIEAGKVTREAYAGWESADDLLYMYTHGTTHIDALGHAWYDDRLYNGFDADSTTGGLDHCGIERVAERGVVGRGVLLDIARHRSVDALPAGDRVSLEEIRACSEAQGTELREGDIVLVRTGAMDLFLDEGAETFYEKYEDTHGNEPILNEPGVTFTEEVCEWFQAMSIPLFGSDTVTAEQTVSETTGTRLPLHPVLLRDLGVLISEMNRLGPLSSACDADGRHEFMYVAAPLAIVGGTGSPVNPLAIR